MIKSLSGILFIVLIILGLSSCVTRKQITYFLQEDTSKLPIPTGYEPVIQANDQVQVLVTSVDKDASNFFSFSQNDNSEDAPGYLVSVDGFIDVPLIGRFHIAGLTTAQAKDSLKKRFERYINGPTVLVVLKTFRVTMLGAVTHPGILETDHEKLTIIEAIAESGDLTINARRDNIMIIRQKGTGREYGQVDITSKAILTSPYYNLHSNDIVYVEPGNRTRLVANEIYFATFSVFIGFVTLFYFISRK